MGLKVQRQKRKSLFLDRKQRDSPHRDQRLGFPVPLFVGSSCFVDFILMRIVNLLKPYRYIMGLFYNLEMSARLINV